MALWSIASTKPLQCPFQGSKSKLLCERLVSPILTNASNCSPTNLLYDTACRCIETDLDVKNAPDQGVKPRSLRSVRIRDRMYEDVCGGGTAPKLTPLQAHEIHQDSSISCCHDSYLICYQTPVRCLGRRASPSRAVCFSSKFLKKWKATSRWHVVLQLRRFSDWHDRSQRTHLFDICQPTGQHRHMCMPCRGFRGPCHSCLQDQRLSGRQGPCGFPREPCIT